MFCYVTFNYTHPFSQKKKEKRKNAQEQQKVQSSEEREKGRERLGMMSSKIIECYDMYIEVGG